MDDVMVSIRMPESLLEELNREVKDGHYIDVSELLRTIVRRRWNRQMQPELSLLRKLRTEIADDLKAISKEKVQKEVNKELKRIQEHIRKGGMIDE